MPEAVACALTIGHSNHPFETFLGLLCDQRVQIVADTRSQPYSKYAPQYDQEAMRAALQASGIRYLFFGRELGGRPSGAEFYDAEGHVLYDRVAASPLFQEGLARLEKDLRQFRVALLCGEENPAGCHRIRASRCPATVRSRIRTRLKPCESRRRYPEERRPGRENAHCLSTQAKHGIAMKTSD